MKTTGTTNNLLADAAEWRLLSLLLSRPRPGWADEVRAVAEEVEHRGLRATARGASAMSEGEYLALIGPGGGASPRAVSYRGFEDPGHILARIAAAYDAFGFRPRSEDPIDHIAVLTDFVAYLFVKEAFARAQGNRAAAATTASARRQVLATHLSPMAAELAKRLAALSDAALTKAARLVARRVPRARHVAPPAPELPSACGACERRFE